MVRWWFGGLASQVVERLISSVDRPFKQKAKTIGGLVLVWSSGYGASASDSDPQVQHSADLRTTTPSRTCWDELGS